LHEQARLCDESARYPRDVIEVPDEVRFAAELLPLTEDAGWEWDYHHAHGNYDPGATLSAVQITIKEAVASSPTQILLYHKGRYVGPAMSEARAFVSLRLDECTDDSVSVQFTVPAGGHAGSITIRHNVTYKWQGEKIVQLGRPPSGK
jgi:hypothetical protein